MTNDKILVILEENANRMKAYEKKNEEQDVLITQSQKRAEQQDLRIKRLELGNGCSTTSSERGKDTYLVYIKNKLCLKD